MWAIARNNQNNNKNNNKNKNEKQNKNKDTNKNKNKNEIRGLRSEVQARDGGTQKLKRLEET